MIKTIVAPNAEKRVDVFLSRILNEPRHQIQKWIRAQGVFINQHLATAASPVRAGDTVRYTLPESTAEPQQAHTPLNIIFEDDFLLVINKPAGLVVHQGAGVSKDTLVLTLRQHCPTLSTMGGSERLGIVHRLDKMTEGLMVIAKTNDAHAGLSAQFKARTITKKYYAFVKGNVREDAVQIHTAIARHPTKRTRMHVLPLKHTATEKEAVSLVRVLARYGTKTWIEIEPKTGRTHQIRVHLAHCGHPIIGDTVYGTKRHIRRGHGQLLQAYYLAFRHPITSQRLEFSIPLSERLQYAKGNIL